MKTPLTRRGFLKTSTLAAGAGLTLSKALKTVIAKAPSSPASPSAPGTVSLQLLDGKALSLDSGVSFGVPWPQGSVKRNETFALTANGKHLPVQSWPLAYWPDGSLKWSAHALAPGIAPGDGPFEVVATKVRLATSLRVTESATAIEVDTGAMVCRFARSGTNIISTVVRDGREALRDGRLVLLRQDRGATSDAAQIIQETFESAIDDVSRVVHDALQNMENSTVQEQDVSGDAKKYDVQIGDDTVTVNVGGAVSQ